MSDSFIGSEDFDRLADSFIARLRGGERPSLAEYAERHPALADKILDLFPALVEMEGLKPDEAGPTGSFDAQHDPTPDAALPKRLGDYRILREVGRGGMGVVYEAERESLKAHVALKVLHSQFRDNAAYRARFRNEARSAARLHHTNIVSVFDFGEHEGVLYYAMQYIAGHGLDRVLGEVRRLRNQPAPPAGDPPATLAEALLSGRFDDGWATPDVPKLPRTMATNSPAVEAGQVRISDPPSRISTLTGPDRPQYHREVARIGAEVADALAYAHGRGVLHRDIKPSNLLLDARGTAWVTDFGLAKFEGGEDLTASGDVVGTLRYIAPERFDSRSDGRCDTYALGVTLYEMLALRPAFDDRDRARLIRRILHHEPTPLRKLDPRISLDLATVVHKAMAREPADRFATAAELAAELRRVAANQPIKSRRIPWREQSWRWCKRNPIVACLLMSLLVVFSGGTTISTYYAREAIKRAREADERLFQSLKSQAEAGLTSRQIGQRLKTLRIIREAAAIHKSPDLRDLAISALALPDVQTLRQIPLPACKVIHGFDCQLRRVAISVDEGRGIEVWDTYTNTRLRTVSAMGTRHDGQLSPDGRWLVDSSGSSNVTRVWDVDSQAGPVRTLATSGRNRVSFDHPGKLAAVNGNGRIVVYEVDGWKEKLALSTGQADQVLFRPGRPEIARLSGRTITVVRLSDGVPVTTLDLKAAATTFAWHPDGTRIAVNSSRKLHLWDVDRRIEIGEVPGDTSGGDTIAFTPEGDALMSTGWDGTVRFHETHPFRQRFVLNEVYTDYTPFFLGRGEFTRQFVAGRTAPVFRYIRGRESAIVETARAEKNISSAVHPSGRWCAMGILGTGEISIHALDGRSIARVQIDLHDGGGLRFDAAGNLFTSTRRGLYCWPVQGDPRSGWTIGPPQRQPPFDSPIFAPSADGQWVLRHSSEPRWTVHSVKPPRGRVALGSRELGTEASLSPDGRFAVTGVAGGSEFIAWDARTGRPLKRLRTEGFKAVPTARIIPTFSPDGRRLLLSVWWGTTSKALPLELYATNAWVKLRDLGEGFGGAFSPDGTHVAYEEGPGIIRLVATESGKTLARLRHPDGLRGGLSYSADGSRLFAQRMDCRGSYTWNLRAIRERLGELGLDWDAPPLPSETERMEPLKVTFVGAELLDPNSAACRARRLFAPLLHGGQADPDDDLSQADELACLGWHDLALAAYSAAIRRDPGLTHARLHRGLEFFRRGKWEAAAEDFQAHLKDDPDCAHRAECQTRIAWSLHERGRDADAAAELTDLVERPRPSWKRAYRAAVLLLRAEFFDLAKKLDAAKADRDRAATLTSNLAKAANNVAWAWLTPDPARTPAENWRLVPAALILARKAVALDPAPTYQNTLGVALFRSGQYAEGRAVLEASLAAGKGDQDAWPLFPLAMCQHRLGERKAARETYDRAVAWLAGRDHSAIEGDPRELADLRAEARRLLGLRD